MRVAQRRVGVRRLHVELTYDSDTERGAMRVVNDAQLRLPALCSCGNMQAKPQACSRTC
jgi:hypothetical protein